MSRLDDIEDGSQLRRGRPAAHIIYGTSQTVNSATYLCIKACRLVEQLQHPSECRNVYLGS